MYYLKELDGLSYTKPMLGNLIKKFFLRQPNITLLTSPPPLEAVTSTYYLEVIVEILFTYVNPTDYEYFLVSSAEVNKDI